MARLCGKGKEGMRSRGERGNKVLPCDDADAAGGPWLRA